MNDAVLKEGLNGGKSGGASCEMMRKETSVRTVCFKKMKKSGVKLGGNGILSLGLASHTLGTMIIVNR